MSIASIGGASGPLAPSRSSSQTYDPYAGQIKELQRKIKALRENDKMDPQQKQMLLEQYNQQITELQGMQARQSLENMAGDPSANRSDNTAAPADTIPHTDELTALSKDTQKALVQVSSNKEQSRVLSGLRSEKTREAKSALNENFLKPADPATAIKATAQAAALGRMEVKQSMESVKAMRGDGDAAPRQAAIQRQGEEDEVPVQRSGTGRMEPGQFLDDEG